MFLKASGIAARARSCRVVDLDELVRDPQPRRHMGRHGRGAVALGGVVATGVEDHAALARQMRLRFGYLAGDEGLRPGGDGGLEITLRPTAAPSYFFDSCRRLPHLRDWPIMLLCHLSLQILKTPLFQSSVLWVVLKLTLNFNIHTR